MKAEIVREEMNRCGRAGIPFLFGVDFEGIHGFFVEKPLSDPSVYFTIGTIGHYKTPLSPIPEPRIKILALKHTRKNSGSYIKACHAGIVFCST